jgi:LDH2 family malate/lactate/ureidoglycolate dehydrogenase
MSERNKTLSLAQVDDLARRALGACGAHGQQLGLAVQSVVDAECDSIRTVGLGYLPLYCGHLQVGKNNTGGEPKVGQFFIAISPGEFTPGGDSAYTDRQTRDFCCICVARSAVFVAKKSFFIFLAVNNLPLRFP